MAFQWTVKPTLLSFEESRLELIYSSLKILKFSQQCPFAYLKNLFLVGASITKRARLLQSLVFSRRFS